MIRSRLLTALAALTFLATPPAAADHSASAVTCSFDVASDTSTIAFGTGDAEPHPAVIAPSYSSYAQIPAGPGGTPRFIWHRVPAQLGDEAVFTRSGTSDCGPTLGTLYVSADDRYVASWNGQEVASCQVPEGDAACQRYQIVTVVIAHGVNTLTIVGSNARHVDPNPAMVQFRVTTEAVTEGDADAEFVAVSGTGNASCKSHGYPHLLPGDGDAWSDDALCVAVSLSGNATCDGGSILNLGGCAAASGSGNATCWGTCVAASGTGDASGGYIAASGTGASSAWTLAASGTGDSGGSLLAASGTGNASATLAAVSITGNASSEETVIPGWGCFGFPPCPNIGVGSAASVTGDARCTFSGDVSLCIPVSVTGHAPGGVSACDQLAARGRTEACIDSEDEVDAWVIAASVSGDAACHFSIWIWNPSGAGEVASACVAASGSGNATCWTGVNAIDPGPCAALSGTGNASCFGLINCAAASGTGNASCWSFAACAAASGTGDASCSSPACAAVSGTGDASCTARYTLFGLEGRCIAVSATGHASGDIALSACDQLAARGRSEACT